MLIPTKVETYPLLEDRPLAKLIAYTAGTSDQLPRNEKRKAVLIIPGGAYWMLGDAEADPVAHFFLSEGFNAIPWDAAWIPCGRSPSWKRLPP